MSRNISIAVFLSFLYIYHLSIVESVKEGTLDCVKIQGTYQWSVYLKCSGRNEKFCWFGCQLPKSFSRTDPVQKDCLCDVVEEKQQKRRARSSWSPIIIPEPCFNPFKFNKNWFHTCLISRRSSMKDLPVIRVLNEFLQIKKSIWNVLPFYITIAKKLKPVVVQIFRKKLSDADLEKKINKYFLSAVSPKIFSCNMGSSQETSTLYRSILDLLSKLNIFTDKVQECVFLESGISFQRFTVVTNASRRKKIIENITRNWGNRNIRYVQNQHWGKTEVFAWISSSSGPSKILFDIIERDLHDYFINSQGDGSRAFIRKDNETRYCTSHVGCIKLSVPYKDIVENKEMKIPESFSNLGVQFWRYTSASQVDPITDLIESDIQCLQSNNSLFYIIHGFTDNGKKSWVNNMKNALLKKKTDSTVVVVDWEKGAHTFSKSNYYQAAINTYALGGIVAYALKKHHTDNGCFQPSAIHIIGHSLGGQTAGFVGQTYRTISGLSLGHITGLDPAGPFFGEKPHYLRLDQTDASFVGVLHTNARNGEAVLSNIEAGLKLKLGVKFPAGHIDFYVNGGVKQPGCFLQKPGCSHVRSQAYFTESIKSSGCKFVGFRCKGNSISAKVENCISKTDYDMNDRTVMGFGRTKHAEGIYYVETTSDKNQFCNSTIWSQHPSFK